MLLQRLTPEQLLGERAFTLRSLAPETSVDLAARFLDLPGELADPREGLGPFETLLLHPHTEVAHLRGNAACLRDTLAPRTRL
ncbi:MAG: hypothetical protein Q8S13_09510, partial [Dehalococcoidia bacterium]|nr:hypothetical protein [Dehalococcoidia bacterium]